MRRTPAVPTAQTARRFVVETMGLEPTTPCLQSRCSSQLSYVPAVNEQATALPPAPRTRPVRPRTIAG